MSFWKFGSISGHSLFHVCQFLLNSDFWFWCFCFLFAIACSRLSVVGSWGRAKNASKRGKNEGSLPLPLPRSWNMQTGYVCNSPALELFFSTSWLSTKATPIEITDCSPYPVPLAIYFVAIFRPYIYSIHVYTYFNIVTLFEHEVSYSI